MRRNLEKGLGLAGCLVALIFTTPLDAYEAASITDVRPVSLEGPIHHGLVIETGGISDPNLTAYEVQIKPDGGGPFPPWQIYNTEVQPFDGTLINLPYRNGTQALQPGITYCVRVRAVYGREVTSWAQRCGLTLSIPSSPSGDSDGDGILDADEFARGTDPQDPDSDRDGVNDGTEVANGTDPNHAYYPDLIVRTFSIDFGEGTPFGRRRNQHQFIEIENTGEEVARIQEIRVVATNPAGETAFHIGAVPAEISHIPTRNILRLPVSFIPTRRGWADANLEIIATNNPDPIPVVGLRGFGIEIPDCDISPTLLDFGTVAVNDQRVLTQEILIRNMPTDDVVVETPFGFTMGTTVDGFAPGIRGFILPHGTEIRIPILFQHPEPGDYNGFLEIRSAVCGVQQVEMRGRAE